MTALPQPRTTKYGPRSKGNLGRYDSTTPPPAEHVSYAPDRVGLQYGWVKIISAEVRYTRKGWHTPMMLTECTGCGRRQWTNLESLRLGRSKGCQSCSSQRTLPKYLDQILTTAKQRCTNPNDPNWKRYGARGITFDFPSVTEAGLWILENLGERPPKHELDRVDNNRGYAPGNLRWATRKQNAANRQNTILEEYKPEEWPYAVGVVRRRLREGLTREQIIEQARQAVKEKRKNWRGIEQRLQSMTS